MHRDWPKGLCSLIDSASSMWFGLNFQLRVQLSDVFPDEDHFFLQVFKGEKQRMGLAGAISLSIREAVLAVEVVGEAPLYCPLGG